MPRVQLYHQQLLHPSMVEQKVAYQKTTDLEHHREEAHFKGNL